MNFTTHTPEKSKRVYLDYAAATPVDPAVIDAMLPFFAQDFGNPSSIHREGVHAKRALDNARASIAGALAAHPSEIIFTASATESAHLAIVGTISAWMRTHPNLRPHVIVSSIEHDAVLSAVRTLPFPVTVSYLPTNEHGIVDAGALGTQLREETVIVSVMYANNEIGTIQPIKEIASQIRRWKKEVRKSARDTKKQGDAYYPLLHTDACQATNYLPLSTPELGVDLLTLNAAKIYGPKGVGALFVGRGVPLLSVIAGGGQESERRGGTENIPLIVGFAHALQLTQAKRESEVSRLLPIRDKLIALLQQISGTRINGSLQDRLPNNVNFSVQNVDHEFLTIALDARGFAVSTKSACNERDAEHSHVLEALCAAGGGGSTSGIRVSLGRTTTLSDVEQFVCALEDILAHQIVSR